MINQKYLDEIKERIDILDSPAWDSTFVGLSKPQYSIISSEHEYKAHIYEKEDAEFIAHARQDVPALVAEVERLREALGLLGGNE